MRLDVNRIENNLYVKICEDFSDFAQKKLSRYKSVLEFLKVTNIKTIVNNTTAQVYEIYSNFCKAYEFDKLDHTVFSRTICECGFKTHSQIKQENGKRKKYIYFIMQ